MAKRKAITRTAAPANREVADSPRASATTGLFGEPSFTFASAVGLVGAIIAAALVYAGYWPGDSTEVQAGSARYLVGLILLAATIAVVVRPPVRGSDWLPDAAAWSLPAWMTVSTWANSGAADLRLAVNELWWWIAAAALFTAVRRCMTTQAATRATMAVIAGVALGVALVGWHQLLISFPETIRRFEEDPVATMRDAGVYAEEGSAEWISFYDRLHDGGPMGTFALANSMAAFLLGGTVVMIGLACRRSARLSVWGLGVWIAAIGIAGGMVSASRSRSAVVSMLVVGLLFAVSRWWTGRASAAGRDEAQRQPDRSHRRRRGVIAGLVGLSAAAALGVGLWDRWKETEWIGQAPLSIAIRLNYWRASARMLADSPWFGVGPGQFKARYEAYRAPEAVEQISDPHNWFWQASTTGGLPAGLLLSGLAALIAVRSYRRLGRLRGEQPAAMEPAADQRFAYPRRWIFAGAGASAAAMWIAGAVVGYLPTLDAGLAATLAAAALVVFAARSQPADASGANAQHDFEADADTALPLRTAAWALLAVSIDLLAAGGLTVPGVAVLVWVLAGIAVPFREAASPNENTAAPQGTARSAAGLAGMLLIAAWYVTAVLPIENAAGPMGRFEMAWTQRRFGEAELALRRAADADRWNPQPVILLTDLLSQAAIMDARTRAEAESRWDAAEAETLDRAGPDPVTLRRLADMRLWHYQRYGERPSLLRAAELYEQAVALSPSHQTYAAQFAEVLRELGRQEDAKRMASRAESLSEAGGFWGRSLDKLIIRRAIHAEEEALFQPLRDRADEVLEPLL